jgi:Protein of unknown function (DUF4238)
MTPKGQHFIPRLHLQHFAGPTPKGQVWTYDAIGAKTWSSIPQETAVQTHFYSAENGDGSMDTRIEEFLSVVESAAAPVYEGLLKGAIPKDSQARMDFAQFLALMHVRTPAMRRMNAEIQGRGIQIHNYAYASNPKAFDSLTRRVEKEKGEPINPKIKEEIRKLMRDPSGYELIISKERTLSALRPSDKLTPILYKMKWSLALAMHGFFVTSDNPLVRQVDPKTHHPIYGDHGFLNKTAEVTFPLSPKLLLLLSWQEDAREFGAFERDHVHLVNKARAANSDRYLYAHIHDKRLERLAAEFKDSRPQMTTQGFGPDQFVPIKIARRLKK